MPTLLGRREIGVPPAGANTNQLMAKHLHTRGFVLQLQLVSIELKQGQQS